jgi:hypothetical protein
MKLRSGVIMLAAVGACAAAVQAQPTWSAWTATTQTGSGTIAAVADWQAPAVGATVIGKSAGGTAGFIHQGGGYYVYANVTDSGNPASGTTAVSAGAAALTTGQTVAPLTAGTFTMQGVSYNMRSGLLTANAALAAADYATTIATTDAAGNSATVAGATATVDDTAPTGVSAQTANGGAIAGRPDAGDTVTYTWSEMLDPYSVLASWTGASTPAQVYIVDNGTSDDTVTIHSTTGQTLPFGAIDLNKNYVTSTCTFNATLVQSAGTITVTLGSLVSGSPRTDTSNVATIWSTGTVTGATDRAGNALTAATITEPGAADHEF